jgi:hypothetical protein
MIHVKINVSKDTEESLKRTFRFSLNGKLETAKLQRKKDEKPPNCKTVRFCVEL